MVIMEKESLFTCSKPHSIPLIAQNVYVLNVDMANFCGYFSSSVDSTVYQLSVVLRYLKNGRPFEQVLIFLELKIHTGEEMSDQVLQYFGENKFAIYVPCAAHSLNMVDPSAVKWQLISSIQSIYFTHFSASTSW